MQDNAASGWEGWLDEIVVAVGRLGGDDRGGCLPLPSKVR